MQTNDKVIMDVAAVGTTVGTMAQLLPSLASISRSYGSGSASLKPKPSNPYSGRRSKMNMERLTETLIRHEGCAPSPIDAPRAS